MRRGIFTWFKDWLFGEKAEKEIKGAETIQLEISLVGASDVICGLSEVEAALAALTARCEELGVELGSLPPVTVVHNHFMQVQSPESQNDGL